MKYKIIKQDNVTYHIYTNTDEAWAALTPAMFKRGWRIGCYGEYENRLYR